MTKSQMLREMDHCFRLALEGGLSAAEKNSLDVRFTEMLMHLQAEPTHNQAVLARMKWVNIK